MSDVAVTTPVLQVAAYRCRLCGSIASLWAPSCHACYGKNCLDPTTVDPKVLANKQKTFYRFERQSRARGPRDGGSPFGSGGVPGIRPLFGRGDSAPRGAFESEEEEDDDDEDPDDDGDAEPIGAVDATPQVRVLTHIPEVDAFFNGGPPRGNAIMIGGAPGIGKSSFGLQLLAGLARRRRKCLIITGEEEKTDVAQRLERFKGFSSSVSQFLYIKKTDCFERMLEQCDKLEPVACLVDSLPVLISLDEPDLQEGSPKLVKLLAKRLRSYAAESGILFLVIVHETKNGRIAGPNTVKHWLHGATRFEQPFAEDSEEVAFYPELLDVRKLVFDGKYRGGPTNRRIYFTMDEDGLHPIAETDLPVKVAPQPGQMRTSKDLIAERAAKAKEGAISVSLSPEQVDSAKRRRALSLVPKSEEAVAIEDAVEAKGSKKTSKKAIASPRSPKTEKKPLAIPKMTERGRSKTRKKPTKKG